MKLCGREMKLQAGRRISDAWLVLPRQWRSSFLEAFAAEGRSLRSRACVRVSVGHRCSKALNGWPLSEVCDE